MTDTHVAMEVNPKELLATGRRHLVVKDFTAAAEALSMACELLGKEHGDLADQCAEPYLWYGKSLLGLAREESGVLGDGVPGAGNNEDDDDEQEENGEEDNNGEAEQTGEAEAKEDKAESATEKDGEPEKSQPESAPKENGEVEKPESTTKDEEPSSSKPQDDGEPTTTNGEGDADESVADLENDDVDNLQLAWEMLDLSRRILERRVSSGGGDAARALLADVHLALGEVALESETYDQAVIDMQSCLELQKELYRSDDRRIAETHYQIGLANSLASNFEEAITHFKNAANILETRIKTLENPTAAAEDATVKKYTTADPHYSIEGEIKELKELLPEIQEKIQDMMDYKAETLKRVRQALVSSNGEGSSNGASVPSAFSSGNSSGFPSGSSSAFTSGNSADAGSSSSKPVSNISHLIKRKRKASDSEEGSASKKPST